MFTPAFRICVPANSLARVAGLKVPGTLPWLQPAQSQASILATTISELSALRRQDEGELLVRAHIDQPALLAARPRRVANLHAAVAALHAEGGAVSIGKAAFLQRCADIEQELHVADQERFEAAAHMCALTPGNMPDELVDIDAASDAEACSSVGSECDIGLINLEERRERRQGRREDAEHAAAPPVEPAFVSAPTAPLAKLFTAAAAPGSPHLGAAADTAAQVLRSQQAQAPSDGTAAPHEGATRLASAGAAAVALHAPAAWFGDPPDAVQQAAEELAGRDDLVCTSAPTIVHAATVKEATSKSRDAVLVEHSVARRTDVLRCAALRRVMNKGGGANPGWLCEGAMGFGTLLLQVRCPSTDGSRACV